MQTEPRANAKLTTKKERKGRAMAQSLLRHSAFEIGGAVVVGIGAIIIARAAFGVDSVFIVVAIGYVAFMATVATVEFFGGPPDETVIDLTAPDDLAPDPRSAALATRTGHRSRSGPAGAPQEGEGRRRRRVAGRRSRRRRVRGAAADLSCTCRASSASRSGGTSRSSRCYFVLTRDRSTSETAIDRVVTVFVWSVGLLVATVLAWMVTYVVIKGLKALSWEFFTEDLSKIGPLDSGRRSEARDHRNARAGRYRDDRRRSGRDHDRGLLARDQRPAREADPVHRRRDERSAEHRRRVCSCSPCGCNDTATPASPARPRSRC